MNTLDFRLDILGYPHQFAHFVLLKSWLYKWTARKTVIVWYRFVDTTCYLYQNPTPKIMSSLIHFWCSFHPDRIQIGTSSNHNNLHSTLIITSVDKTIAQILHKCISNFRFLYLCNISAQQWISNILKQTIFYMNQSMNKERQCFAYSIHIFFAIVK